MKLSAWALFIGMAAVASANVVDSSASGFTVKLSMDVKGSPADVYSKFVHNVSDWWNPEHTFSGSAKNLSIDDKPMGCFCEKLPQGGGVRHLEVVYADPGKALTMIGGLGPMQSLATSGTMVITFGPSAGGTRVSMSYSVSGYLSTGMNTWAAPADGMLTDQFTRLKKYAEKP